MSTLIAKSITEQIYEIMKDKILFQEYEIGSKIETKEIAEEYNISVMPVRDALKKLCSEELVVNKSRVGFFVRTFSEEEIDNIMELRSVLEIYCLDTYFEKINKNRLKVICHNIKLIENQNKSDFARLDDEFHNLIISSSNNNIVMKNYNNIKDIIVLCRHLDKKRIRFANEEHCQIIESIVSGNKETAIEQLKTHISNFDYSIKENIKKL